MECEYLRYGASTGIIISCMDATLTLNYYNSHNCNSILCIACGFNILAEHPL